MVVQNRTRTGVQALAWWQNGPRVRLGPVAPGATATFTTPHRGAAVWLSLDVLRERAGVPDRPDRFVPLAPGDGIHWTILATQPTIELDYARLPPG